MHREGLEMAVSGYLSDDAVHAVVDVRRFVNDSIKATADVSSASAVLEFICECGDLRCKELVKLTLDEFENSRPGTVVSH